MKAIHIKNLWLVSLIVLAVVLATSILGVSVLSIAHAQEEQPTSVVKLTSYTTVMSVEEEFEFAAQVTLADGTVTDEVTWSTSDEAVIGIEDGLAIAIDEGTATITATAEDGAFASIDVLVSDSAIRVASVDITPAPLTLGVGWDSKVYVTVLPLDATDPGYVLSSSDSSIVTVDQDGNLHAVAAGTADIVATTNDGNKTATCVVTVKEDLLEAQLSEENASLNLGQSKDITVVLPEGVDATGAEYQWFSSDDTIATFDANPDEIGTLYSWDFGTVEIRVVVILANGDVYAANGTALVTEDFFYLVGIRNDWSTYETAADAEAAGMLLTADASRPGVYSITRNFWAYDSFQIIHSNIDEGWSSKITPYWYYAEGSDTEYVENTADMFEVNTRADYTITLDLSSGHARVSIDMVDLTVTEIDLSLAEGQHGYLVNEGDTTILNITTLPANAIEPAESDIEVSVSSNATGYAEAKLSETDNKQVIVTLLQPSATLLTFTVEVKIDDAVGVYPITIHVADSEYTAVTEIAFEQEIYNLNVNNGGEPWTVQIKANVNADASIQGVYYMSDDDSLLIEYDAEGNAYARASKLGTFTIEAYAIGDTSYTAKAQVVVFSQDGFYLIGILQGKEVNEWTSLAPEVTSLTGTEFADWALTAIDDTHYTGTFTLNVGDQFSIAFLGMSHEWGGVINNAYFDAQNSAQSITLDGINIQINVRGIYQIDLDLSGENPVFTVTLKEELEPLPVITYRYVYVVWSGTSWNSGESQRGNIIVQVGTLTYSDGVLQNFTLTSGSVNFYELATERGVWPTIQFVITDDMHDGDYFVNPEWYGSATAPVIFGGDAYSDYPGTDGTFTNSGCELYWVGNYEVDPDDPEAEIPNMTVTFTFHFDEESGALTSIDVNFVTPSVDPAE